MMQTGLEHEYHALNKSNGKYEANSCGLVVVLPVDIQSMLFHKYAFILSC
jgi:hypothetical protein